jgi:hypothetical protein
MHDEMNEPLDERNDNRVIDAVRATYHVPPATPRDEMWSAIERATSVRPIRRSVTPAWWGAMAAGIVLAAGIAIGRWSAGGDRGTVTNIAVITAPAKRTDSVSAMYEATAQRHFAQSEVLLTEYRARAREGKSPDVTVWARDLLGTTRLLMDSPAATDARMRTMLEDLELILAQIVQAGASREKSTDFVERALEERALLEKLRTAVPAGATWSGS